MENVVLLVTIAEIAGVFVGFAALISVTGRAEVEASYLGEIRALVTIGLVVVVAALVPVGLGAYEITGHTLWFISSLAYLLLTWAVVYLSLRRPENRRVASAQVQTKPFMAALFWILEIPIHVPLLLIVFNVSRQVDSALYLTALVFHLFQAVIILAQLVYEQAE